MSGLGRRVVGVAAYPAVMAATMAIAWTCLAHGWPAWAAIAPASLVSGSLVLLLERVIPYSRDWLHSKGDLRTDLGHLLIGGPVAQGLAGGLAVAVAWLASALTTALGTTVWPNAWPLWAQVPLGLVVAELGGYWLHRLEHETVLWRIHAVHHSAPRLYFLNSLRVHPIDAFLTISLTMLPLVLVGASESTVALVAAYAGTHMLLQHANLDVRLGPANWIFSMAEVHRWHHSPVRSEMDANYGGVLLVWDIVFRTRRVPRDRTFDSDIVVGIPEIPDYPTGYAGQVLSPFRRRIWLTTRSE